MKIIYLECAMGAAGDMLSSALYELVPESERENMLAALNAMGLPGVVFQAEKTARCGITGTRMHVIVNGCEEGEAHAHSHEHEHTHEHEHEHEHCHEHEHTHAHYGMAEVEHHVRALAVSESVKEHVLSVYREIAKAESKAHGQDVSLVHFHEVGALDAIADVAAVSVLFEYLAPEKIYASPVATGSGFVHCAHGILPVPAPATAALLTGIPSYAGEEEGELCTPTGAALLRHFVTEFRARPLMEVASVGYGMGKKDFKAANCLRAFLGTAEENREETVLELSCNVDDMTAEEIGFAMEALQGAGALEVFTLPCGMKKSRPGVLLTVLCREGDRKAMCELLFRHTSTIGIRERECLRHVLTRRTEAVETPIGTAHRKISRGFGTEREKWEYEDVRRIALTHDLSLREAAAILDAEVREKEENPLQNG